LHCRSRCEHKSRTEFDWTQLVVATPVSVQNAGAPGTCELGVAGIISVDHLSGECDATRCCTPGSRFERDSRCHLARGASAGQREPLRCSFTPVGGRGRDGPQPRFDQQPIEASTMTQACARTFGHTGDRRWAQAARRSGAWCPRRQRREGDCLRSGDRRWLRWSGARGREPQRGGGVDPGVRGHDAPAPRAGVSGLRPWPVVSDGPRELPGLRRSRTVRRAGDRRSRWPRRRGGRRHRR
jgi:hypothetical protein